jgi:hypothetical protein
VSRNPLPADRNTCVRCGYDKANHQREAHPFVYPDGESFLAGLDDLGDCTPDEAVEAVKAARAESSDHYVTERNPL